jgi:hypothetical protein
MENNDFDDDFENDFDLKGFLEKYLKQWQWFVLAVSICLLGSFYTTIYTPIQSDYFILVKDEKKACCRNFRPLQTWVWRCHESNVDND